MFNFLNGGDFAIPTGGRREIFDFQAVSNADAKNVKNQIL
jgi:hypothetical protein